MHLAHLYKYEVNETFKSLYSHHNATIMPHEKRLASLLAAGSGHQGGRLKKKGWLLWRAWFGTDKCIKTNIFIWMLPYIRPQFCLDKFAFQKSAIQNPLIFTFCDFHFYHFLDRTAFLTKILNLYCRRYLYKTVLNISWSFFKPLQKCLKTHGSNQTRKMKLF
jgi:hypothetical protein